MAAGALGTLFAAAVAGAQVSPGAVATPAARAASAPASARLKLAVNEFKISPFAASVKAGRLEITVKNGGKEAHEVLLVTAGKLPMKRKRVDEDALQRKHRVVGEIADVKPGRSASRTFALRKGGYMLFCNLPGHYGSGMRASLVVRSGATGR
jgi:uncharacterized cupredoxin-like copper-binding protein